MMQINDLFRWCNDIGMYASDRPINNVGDVEGSCVHRSPYCDDTCFNIKLYRMYPNMGKRDVRCEKEWVNINEQNVHVVSKHFKRKRKQTKRIRHMTRGEAFKTMDDVYRVKAMAEEMPDTTWWIPTKAWRDPAIRFLIEVEIMPMHNVALNASTDPSTTKEQWESLHKSGWNIMFYGDNDMTTDPVTGERMFACPKTHKHIKGHCADCKAGCFSQTTTFNKRRTIHLCEH